MSEIELHEYISTGDYEKRLTGLCSTCGQPYREIHHVPPEGWCNWDTEDHDWPMGALECTRCGAESPVDMCEGCGDLCLPEDLDENDLCEGCRS
jgi:hypothetical protein